MSTIYRGYMSRKDPRRGEFLRGEKGYSDETVEQIRALASEGLIVSEIAERLGLKESTVSNLAWNRGRFPVYKTRQPSRRWSSEDRGLVEGFIEQGMSNAWIAERFNRTERAIEAIRYKMKKDRIGCKWTLKEVDELEKLFIANLSDEEIAEKLKRTPQGVKWMRQAYGLLHQHSSKPSIYGMESLPSRSSTLLNQIKQLIQQQ